MESASEFKIFMAPEVYRKCKDFISFYHHWRSWVKTSFCVQTLNFRSFFSTKIGPPILHQPFSSSDAFPGPKVKVSKVSEFNRNCIDPKGQGIVGCTNTNIPHLKKIPKNRPYFIVGIYGKCWWWLRQYTFTILPMYIAINIDTSPFYSFPLLWGPHLLTSKFTRQVFVQAKYLQTNLKLQAYTEWQ